jgi:hypothetical protein
VNVPTVKHHTFSTCIWTLGVFSWWFAFIGMVPGGIAVLVIACVLNVIRDEIWTEEMTRAGLT